MQYFASAALLLLLASAELCLAGNYDAYMQALDKRNRQMHDQYLGQLEPGQRNFLDDLDGRVNELQAKHLVQDSDYPQSFDSDRYWAELLGFPNSEAALAAAAAADSEAEAEVAEAGPQSDRRNEEPFMNKVWGTQKVSGGAGKAGQVTGPQDKPQGQQVKTDRLPSYCDPPNPCPKHADPKKLGSPCSTEVHDTAEFNYADTLRKVASGQCPCDSEHMRCPRVPHDQQQAKKLNSDAKNPYLLGNKRDKLDAKKSAKFGIAKRGVRAKFHSSVVEKKNPWLDANEAVDTVEKKNGRSHYEEQLMEAA